MDITTDEYEHKSNSVSISEVDTQWRRITSKLAVQIIPLVALPFKRLTNNLKYMFGATVDTYKHDGIQFLTK